MKLNKVEIKCIQMNYIMKYVLINNFIMCTVSSISDLGNSNCNDDVEHNEQIKAHFVILMNHELRQLPASYYTRIVESFV